MSAVGSESREEGGTDSGVWEVFEVSGDVEPGWMGPFLWFAGVPLGYPEGVVGLVGKPWREGGESAAGEEESVHLGWLQLKEKRNRSLFHTSK